MINILYTKVPKNLHKTLFDSLIQTLPSYMHSDILKYKQEKGKTERLIGKILLYEILKKTNNSKLIKNIEKDSFGRPYFNKTKNIDFNISHAGGYVACALIKNGVIGIDIEKIRNIKIERFQNKFNKSIWDNITNSLNPQSDFFKYWTILESVLKADGQGLKGGLKKVVYNNTNNTVIHNNNIWNIRELNIDKNFFFHICSNKNIDNIKLEKFNIE